jgi:hypothetical protein
MTPDDERLIAVAQLWIDTYNDDSPRCHEVYAPDCEVMLMGTGQVVRGLATLQAGEKAHKANALRQRMVLQRAIPKDDVVVVEVTVEFNDDRKPGYGCGVLTVRDGLVVSDHSYSPWPGGVPEVTQKACTSTSA